MSSKTLKFLAIAPVFALAACADAPFTPIVDGPVSANYQRDLAECRAVSQQAQATSQSATAGAIAGGIVGAVEADSGDELGGAIVGALLGGAVGKADESDEIEARQADIVFNCLKGRGHNVVG